MNCAEVKYLKVDHTPAVLDETSKVLLRAAEILEAGGHCKGSAESNGAHCLSGAISAAALERRDDWGLYEGHKKAIARLRPLIPHWCPVLWNDAPERTKNEVVAKLRAAAFVQ